MSISLLFLELCLLIAFMAVDIYLFYIAFEAVLIPMFFLVGIAGSRARKSKAAFYLFFYTLTGSLCMLVAITVMYSGLQTSRYDIIITQENFAYKSDEYLVFLLFFIAFAIKTPVFPFHLWLPEAHVEAPTTGSIILAGLLLKLGTYGIYRFCILLFPEAAYDLKDYIFILMIVSMFFTSLAALRQTDMKRVVAYSSIVHMSYCVLGLFSFTDFGIKGAFVLMIAHGLVSSSLFALVGVLYDRYKTRFISYYGGLAYAMPQASILFFIAILGNVSFPISASFVGELAIFVGAMEQAKAPLLLVAISLFIGTAFNVFLYNRLFFGGFNVKYIKIFKDISAVEFFVNY
jgi:proton-translocating NADH-quinone oxidoreductase chain M